ncbi:Intraflagellar transport protein -like protein [Sarcoptes scabiei]|uniref:Intraflagellar transport protein -like protein n=1 Tax=Sarcoptes scabiei TaxID=52283 RepID=A0A834RBZ8_SARSC|nr:Intraflagellar transport protein -like protein [Sarcoptes scabiei]
MKLKFESDLLRSKRFDFVNNENFSIDRIQCFSISNDSSKIAICYAKQKVVMIFDLSSYEIKSKFALKAADKNSQKSFQIVAIEFANDGERLAIAQSDNVIFVYRIGNSWDQKKTIINKYSLNCPALHLDWLPSGIVFASSDGRVKLIQTSLNKMSTIINVPDSFCVSMSSYKDQIIVGFQNGQIWYCSLNKNLNSNTNIRESSTCLLITLNVAPSTLAFISSGFICAAGFDGRLAIIEISESEIKSNSIGAKTNTTQAIEIGKEISGAASSSTGSILIVAAKETLIVFELDSKTWKSKFIVDLENSHFITGLRWTNDGTKFIVATINQSVSVFRCIWLKKRINSRFLVDFIGSRQIVIEDCETNHSMMFDSLFEIKDIKIHKKAFAVIYTSDSIIMGSLSNKKHRSEIEWAEMTMNGMRFNFDYENFVIITTAGEIHVIEIGQNQILGSIRTDFISTHLISIRVDEKGSNATKLIAYLVDAKTIAITNLSTGFQLNSWSHSERIDWLELNEIGNQIIFRDKALKLILLPDIYDQNFKILLNSACSFVQWIPASTVIVAQCKEKLYVWYDFDSPTIYPIKEGETNEAYQIERSNGMTKVCFTNPLSDIVLNETRLEFDTAIEKKDFKRAESFLETLQSNSNHQDSLNNQNRLSETGDLKAMWLSLGNLAMKNSDLIIAERAFAAIGDLPKLDFIRQCQEDDNLLALLYSNWDRFETGPFDAVLTAYLKTHNWDRALNYVKKFERRDLIENLSEQHYQWLIDTGQYTMAARILKDQNKIVEAIDLLMKSKQYRQLAGMIVDLTAHSDHETSGSLFSKSKIIDLDVILKVIKYLEQTEAYEEAGDLCKLNLVDDKEKALRFYLKSKSFTKAINLAREYAPDQVVALELQYAEYLLRDLNDPASSINHFIEAGKSDRALEAAVKAKQFDRAAEIAQILETIPIQYGKKIAEYYVSKNEVEPALEIYLNMGCIRDAVQLLNEKGQSVRAYKIAKQFMSADEAREMYVIIAKSYESEKKFQEAERIYIACNDVDAAISMYKNNQEYDSMIRLVKRYHPDLLQETCIYLAKELESKNLFKQAECYYLMAGDWQQAIVMYKNNSKWEDAYRVARSSGGTSLAKQVAFHWAKDMSDIQQSITLLNKFGLLNQVVDYSLENKEFEFALALISNSDDLQHKLTDVKLKYALWLEKEGYYFEAENMYLEANKPREAIVMHLHRNNFDDALRIAENATQSDDNEMVKDILITQARFVFNQMKQSKNFDRLDLFESLLLRAGRIELAISLLQDSGLWKEALRMAEQYAPHTLDSLRRDLISTNNSDTQVASTNINETNTNDRGILFGQDNSNVFLDQVELIKALKEAEKNSDKESIVLYSIILSGQLLKDHQVFDSLRILAKHSSIVFERIDSKKILPRIAAIILADDENESDGLSDDARDNASINYLEDQLQKFSLLRDCLQQFLSINRMTLNRMEKDSFEKFLLIAHYLVIKCTLEKIMQNELDSPIIGSVKELHLKLTISLLRYTDIIRADYAFLDAGRACRSANRFQMAFVFFNHFLDLIDAVDEQDYAVDHSDFIGTDIPTEVPLPKRIIFSNLLIEEIRSWVLQISIDTQISQSLPLRDGQVYEASLLNADQTRCLPCLVTGYPLTASDQSIEFVKGKYAVNKEDWNKLLMITKISNEANLRLILRFLNSLSDDGNILPMN